MNRYQNNGYRNNNRFIEYQNNRNSNMIMYALAIVILALGVGIHMNVIKIPGLNTKNTFTPSTIRGQSLDKKSQQNTPDEIPSEQPTGRKTDEIPCPYDCSSIPGSSCINGKCTDPYLHLQ